VSRRDPKKKKEVDESKWWSPKKSLVNLGNFWLMGDAIGNITQCTLSINQIDPNGQQLHYPLYLFPNYFQARM
jgi:hypothetical protein